MLQEDEDAPTLDDFVQRVMADYDRVLQECEIPVDDRAWRAARIVAQHSFSFEDKDGRAVDTASPEFFLHPLFGVIFRATKRWYERNYSAPSRQAIQPLQGLIYFRGTFLRLPVSPAISRRRDEESLIDVTFPLEMTHAERPALLLQPRQALGRLVRSERATLEAQCLDVGGRLRRIWNHFFPIDGPDPAMRELKDSFLAHLGGAATRVAESRGAASIGFGMMDLRLEWRLHSANPLI